MDSLFDKIIGNFSHNQEVWNKIGTRIMHSCECDDAEGFLKVGASPDGDLHLSVSPHPNALGMHYGFRARTYLGGGRNERVRKALMLLALAIKEDSETKD